MSHLIACLGCARHVRATDPTCPFCGETLPASLRGAAPRLPSERLGRTATFVFGATLAASTAVGCGDGSGSDAGAGTDGGATSDAGSGGADAGGTDAGGGGTDAGYDAGSIAPPYGIPPDDGGFDAGYDAGSIAPPYGIPPDDGGPAPAYGAPPPSP